MVGSSPIVSPHFFFFNDTPTTEIYTLFPTRRSSDLRRGVTAPTRLILVRHGEAAAGWGADRDPGLSDRSEEHTSELQSRRDLVCRLLLEKKKIHSNIKPSKTRIDDGPTRHV